MGASNARRILLISYHYGDACATGGFRWNATTEHLCAHGWHVDVITVARDDLQPPHEATADGRLRIFPVAATLAPTRIKTSLLELGRRLESVLARPGSQPPSDATASTIDPNDLFVWHAGYQRSLRERITHGIDYIERASCELIWSRRAVRAARPLLRAGQYRAIVVSSPPHLTHDAGARLTREFGVPYVADYRDPWTLGLGSHVGFLNDLERIVGRRYEVRTLRRAHTVIHNTERARSAVAGDFSIPGSHVAIRNGYDDAAEVEAPDPSCFRVVYTGHLYPFMDVRPVLAACARLRERHDLTAERMRIDFVGTPEELEGIPLTALAGAYGLADVFHWHPRLPRDEAAQFQRAASVLVAYDWLFPVAVVSKFYEYARMKGAPLLIGNTDGALADAAAEIGLEVLDSSDDPGIDRTLEQAISRWRDGSFQWANDRDGVFARIHQTRLIRQVLENLDDGA